MVLGPLISAGASLIGGALTRSAQKDYNAQQQAQAAQNVRMQEEFARKGVRWRVADARAAGIHPLYALGAQTQSFSPVSVGGTPASGFGAGVAAAGQDLSRAINATRTSEERVGAVQKTVQALQLENMKLQNDVLKTQIASAAARLSQQSNPPIPAIGDFNIPEKSKVDEQDALMFGKRWYSHPRWSPAQAVQNQLGEPAEWMYFPAKLMADAYYNAYMRAGPNWKRAMDTGFSVTPSSSWSWLPRFERR